MSPAEFENAIKKVLPSAYGFALRLSAGNREEAEDALQEASLAAFKGRSTFQYGTNFKAWFFKILVNCSRRRYRGNRIEEVSIEDTTDGYIFSQVMKAGVDVLQVAPDSTVIAKLDDQQIRNAIDALPDEYREASALFFLGEMSYDQIAEVLDVPMGTIRSRLHRGRKLLQRSLWSMAAERGVVDAL